MPAQKKKAKASELRVVFDTNAIFTETTPFLLKKEVSDVVRANSSHPDLQIRWYLPHVVRCEREFQMRENGIALLPAVQRIERILDHNLNITEEIIVGRMQQRIDEQLRQFGITVLQIDTAGVDWTRVINDAAFRIAPFEKGPKEKGFRDAVILESFVQLVAESPVTPRSCRVVLITNDGALVEAVKARTTQAKNVQVLPDIEELRGLINTLVSAVTEEFVASIQAAAKTFFFDKDDADSLYLTDKVDADIARRFQDALRALPAGAEGKDAENTWIGTTRFSKKQRQRVHWVTRVTLGYRAYRWHDPTPRYATTLGTLDLSGLGISSSILSSKPGLVGSSGLLDLSKLTESSTAPESIKFFGGGELIGGSPPTKQKVYTHAGRFEFDVTWSAVVTAQQHKFKSGRTEGIELVEATWKEV
jgi:hypothetical protein